jgi:hypothetical protein
MSSSGASFEIFVSAADGIVRDCAALLLQVPLPLRRT